ncbi:MAG TPA: AAA family ATPase, partial [Mycobacterium sp.]|nr:AAA family ATPase [Mycobacterium sp.]
MRGESELASGWPMVARDDELRRAMATLEASAEVSGVALVGKAGVGKSTLARTLAKTLESKKQPTRFVLGTETGRDLPLGA